MLLALSLHWLVCLVRSLVWLLLALSRGLLGGIRFLVAFVLIGAGFVAAAAAGGASAVF
jgi:hypothetical protein